MSNHPDRKIIIEKRIKKQKQILSQMTEEEKRLKWGKYGKDNPNFGKRWGKEQRKKMSERQRALVEKGGHYMQSEEGRKMASRVVKERWENERFKEKESKRMTKNGNPFYGKKHTEKTKELIRKANTGRKPPSCRPVIILGIQYPSVTEAARQLKIHVTTALHRLNSKNQKFDDYQFYTPPIKAPVAV